MNEIVKSLYDASLIINEATIGEATNEELIQYNEQINKIKAIMIEAAENE